MLNGHRRLKHTFKGGNIGLDLAQILSCESFGAVYLQFELLRRPLTYFATVFIRLFLHIELFRLINVFDWLLFRCSTCFIFVVVVATEKRIMAWKGD